MTRLVFTVILAATSVWVQAQDTMLLQARAIANRIEVKWYPRKADKWVEALKTGYRIERVELTGGQPAGAPVVLAAGVLPQNAAWFEGHKSEADGLMEPIGALLYDSTFQFPATRELNSTEMRYNYVLKEAQNSDMIASAIGLFWKDSTAAAGKLYRYTVRAVGYGKMQGSVDILYKDGAFALNPQDVTLEFKFPNDLSLSKMRNPGKITLPHVSAIAKAYGDSIVLRWGPNSAALWAASNRQGYIIQRRVAAPDGPEENIGLVKPWPQGSVQAKVGQDSIALMAAAQLYSKAGAETAEGFADQAALFENRWAFALYAAERSPLAADLLGLRFVDKNVKRDAVYSYQIQSAAAPGGFSGSVLDVVNTYEKPDEPKLFTAKPGDRVIELHWDKSQNEAKFTAYKIERSGDKGKSWQPLTKSPLVFVEDPQRPLPDFQYRDSVAENYKDYQYRLSGLNSFGDFSKYAEVKTKAVDLTPPPMPEVTAVIYKDTLKLAIIRWTKEKQPDDFAGFYVLLGESAEAGHYDTISPKLKADQTEFIYRPKGGFSGEQAHYFRVMAVDDKGNSIRSLDRYMHVPDLTAPPAPAEIRGNIAQDGTVSIVWSQSTAKDVTGYWIYFANDPRDEFSPLTNEPLTINKYTYQIPAKSLNAFAYYRVLAEDKSNNRGEPSKILKLKRPDKVPPVTPFQLQPVGYTEGIKLRWKNNPDEDLKSYRIFRRHYGGDTTWTLVKTTTSATDTLFEDKGAAMDSLYEYKLQAIDQDGNASEFTVAAAAKRSLDVGKVRISPFVAELAKDNKSVNLSWTFSPPPGVIPPGQTYEFHIYKSQGAKRGEYLTAVPAGGSQYNDTQPLIPGVLYNYSVQVHFDNKQTGEMSEVKSVMINPTGSTPPPADKKKKG